ncbi:hypothetical protein NUW54_g11694 [Trametes sanguinea]|uniref:Uncharacterized protein n=1 Tax=Trametes sanguinea TaxID=158606 RepID=A0ACC1NA38_9APHY|nr:hypothetical protein NUW54_g11694 [Trametes sanguinea]
MGFSPWVTDFGEPIYAPQDFDLNNKIKQAVDRDAMRCRLDACLLPQWLLRIPIIDRVLRRNQTRSR